MKYHIFVLLFICLLLGCDANKPAPKNKVAPVKSNRFVLDGSNIGLDLPEGFMVSSKYRLTNDCPQLEQDSFMLLNIERWLEISEFHDKDIDVFVDTTKEVKVLIFQDMERIVLDKYTGQLLNKDLKKSLSDLEAETNYVITSLKLDADYKAGNAGEYFKFKYRLDYFDKTRFNNFYVLTTPNRTFMIKEISSEYEDMESWIANMKG